MAFPASSVLDNFNRANNATDLGANWTGNLRSGGGWPSPGVLSNQLYLQSAFKSAYWNPTIFGRDQEVYATFPTLPTGGSNGWCELWCRVANPNSGTLQGYFIRVDASNVYPIKWVLGVETVLGDSIATLSAGDKIGMEAIGSTLNYYKNTGSGWTFLTTITDTDISAGGWVGMAAGDPTSFALDDFGGGDSAARYTILNGSNSQLVNVNIGGIDIDAFSYKDNVLLSSSELATLLDGSSFGKKDIAIMANQLGDGSAEQKRRVIQIVLDHLSS